MAKAFIAASELNLRFLPTAWGLNDRGYCRYFGSSRFDFLRLHALATALPTYTFTEEDYLATGEKDFDKAIHVYAEKEGLYDKKAFVLMTEGLWGEFYAIRKAAPFVLRSLYNTRYTLDNLYHFEKRVADRELVVAVNIRLTDFAVPTATTDYRGIWNTRIRLDWYKRVCRGLRASLGDAVTFYLVTDGSEDELSEFIEEFRPLTEFDREDKDISSLLIMARADAIVCSISSYSEWAAFLSKAPYIWYRPHLRPVDGYQTIWASLGELPGAIAHNGNVYARGIPAGDDGELPGWLFDHLEQRRGMNRVSLDLVKGGGVPGTTD